jgi:hypothetical protein
LDISYTPAKKGISMNRLVRALLSALVGAVSLIAASAATAVPPVVELGPYPGFTDTALCGFPIETSFEGTVRTTTHLDQNGDPVQIIQTFPNITVTMTHGDTTVSTKGPAHVNVSFAPDGSVESIAILGMSANITLPDVGRLLFDVGRIVWDADGNIVSENGLHQIFGTAEASAFCAYMA